MTHSRLWSLLQPLTPEERKQFDDFVRSPFFNKNERVVRLWKALLPALADGGDAPSKEKLFRAMYGKTEPFQEQPIHDHASYLTRLAEQFLVQLRMEASPRQSLLLLADAFLEKGLDPHFLRARRKLITLLDASPLRDSRHYLDQFLLGEAVSAFHGRQRDKSVDTALEDASRALDVFYLSTRLKYGCEQLNRAALANQARLSAILPELMQWLNQPGNPYREEPVIAIYHRIFLMLSDPENSESHYRALTALLRQSDGQFSQEEASIMYAFAMNYCTRQINAGKSAWFAEMFQLYQTLLAGHILIGKDGFLAHEHLKNITTVGLRLKEFAWVEDFLTTWREHVAPEHRDNAYYYNLAALHFERQAYRDVLRLLQKVEFTDAKYHINAKSILAKVYFTLDETDSLQSLVKSQLVFLKRSPDLPQYHLTSYEHFFRFTLKAALIRQAKRLRLRSDHTPKASALLARLEATPETASVQWLRTQIEALL